MNSRQLISDEISGKNDQKKQTLAQFIENNGPLPFDAFVPIFYEILKGINASRFHYHSLKKKKKTQISRNS